MIGIAQIMVLTAVHVVDSCKALLSLRHLKWVVIALIMKIVMMIIIVISNEQDKNDDKN